MKKEPYEPLALEIAKACSELRFALKNDGERATTEIHTNPVFLDVDAKKVMIEFDTIASLEPTEKILLRHRTMVESSSKWVSADAGDDMLFHLMSWEAVPLCAEFKLEGEGYHQFLKLPGCKRPHY